MLHIVLYQPEIPPNTGNVIRLCANTGTQLHLIKPLGFDLDHAKLRRAGLDYREFADIRVHDSLTDFLSSTTLSRLLTCSTKGTQLYTDIRFRDNDALVFGPESRGLPPEVLASMPPEHILRIPMLAHSRSLNLSNAAAVMLYEAWRQLGFGGAR